MTESFINEGNKLPDTVQLSLDVYLQATTGKLITIDWKSVKPTRSILQNKYYWGVVIKMLSAEIGYEPEMMHEYMKDAFLDKFKGVYGMPDGGELKWGKTTTALTTKEFDDYLYAIRIWADSFLSLNIPLPNQTQFDYTGFE